MERLTRRSTAISLLAATLIAPSAASRADNAFRHLRSAVVKIYVTSQRNDYGMPWQGGGMRSSTGTGFIIDGKRVMSNAHVVSDARFIQLQKDSDPRRYDATVKFIAHDCDLAVLAVEDPRFFGGTTPVTFAKALPQLNDEVMVIGYPMGGVRISLTRGIVSRIDYSIYSHSGMDLHLVLQVDAAINPGNSGGPIIFHDKVVGVAFQALMSGENIGYVIPVPVVRHFLEDIEDGVYNNYPELGVSFMETRNQALRTDLKLPAELGGVAVSYIDPFGSAKGILKHRDVLLKVDDYDIAPDGTVDLEGNNVTFAELLERKLWGDSAVFDVWRGGKKVAITVPLTNPADPFIYKNIYDERPQYYVNAGLVFMPLNREVLKSAGGSQQLAYYSRYAKIDGLHEGRDEFIVLTKRLPHEVNTYADGFVHGIVNKVNGKAVKELADVKRAMMTPENGFHVIEFAEKDETLVLQTEAVEAANPRIFAAYGITEPEYFGGDR